MFRLSDLFILLAVVLTFFISAFLWFHGHPMQAIYTALWLLIIIGLGIYFKVLSLLGRMQRE